MDSHSNSKQCCRCLQEVRFACFTAVIEKDIDQRSRVASEVLCDECLRWIEYHYTSFKSARVTESTGAWHWREGCCCIVHKGHSRPTLWPHRGIPGSSWYFYTFYYVKITWTRRDRAPCRLVTAAGWLIALKIGWRTKLVSGRRSCGWWGRSVSEWCAEWPQADKRCSLMTSTFLHN